MWERGVGCGEREGVGCERGGRERFGCERGKERERGVSGEGKSGV